MSSIDAVAMCCCMWCNVIQIQRCTAAHYNRSLSQGFRGGLPPPRLASSGPCLLALPAAVWPAHLQGNVLLSAVLNHAVPFLKQAAMSELQQAPADISEPSAAMACSSVKLALQSSGILLALFALTMCKLYSCLCTLLQPQLLGLDSRA